MDAPAPLPHGWVIRCVRTSSEHSCELEALTGLGEALVHGVRCAKGDGIDRARLVESLEALVALRGAELVPLRRVLQHGDWVLVECELPRQVSLATWLGRETRLGMLEVGLTLRQLAAGLSLAHLQGVAHGAIEPARLWWDVPVLRIEGVGLAPALAAASGWGRSLPRGGPYAAPEQRAGGDLDLARSDAFAFGAIAYEVLTGRLPTAEERSPARWREHVPAGLARLVVRCLDPDPTLRPTLAQAHHFLELLVTPPPGHGAHHLLHQAGFLARNGREEQARELLERARELAPDDAEVADALARLGSTERRAAP